MTASDALPVQFWDFDDETFNEEEVCGLNLQDCFCQPFDCDDIFYLQFNSDNPVFIRVHSTEFPDYDINLVEAADGIWAVNDPSHTWGLVAGTVSPECTTRRIQLIVYEDSTTTVGAPDTDWENIPADFTAGPYAGYAVFNDDFDSRAATTFTVNAAAVQKLFRARLPLSIPNGSSTNAITASISVTGVTSGSYLCVMYYGKEDGTPVSNVESKTLVNGVNVKTFTFTTLTDSAEYLFIFIDTTAEPTTFLTVITVTPSYVIFGGENPVLKSDCIEVAEQDGCTQLIQYTNSQDFDGISYGSAMSPDPNFYLRIPAVFYKRKNPQEQEDMELSDGEIVTLRNTITQKKLLETGFLPGYMHLKLQKVLMHDTVIINSIYWKKRDSYEDNQPDKYNLYRASVLLTKQGSIEKNTI